MVGDDPAVLSHFLAGFARSANDAAAGLGLAIEAGDRARAGSLAHQLKGTAGAVGAVRLARLCADIEVAAREADDVALGASWQRFSPEVRRVESWISAHRAGTPSPAEVRPAS
jgi:HPt (histidine-containing phosphotransfer) domain-containing protein